jgi:glycosyltransferase involved in cell wall biosynthesis
MKILHIAAYNISGVPLTMVKAERKLGHYSRLVTFQRDWRSYEEDICLELPGWGQKFLYTIKKIIYSGERTTQSNRKSHSLSIPQVWKAGNVLESIMLRLRDAALRPVIMRAISRNGLESFDVYQLEGGHGFFKYDDVIPAWHRAGKKVICCYYGSDLRRRGVMPEIHAISDCNVTVEWDHLDLLPGIRHVPYPFDASRFKAREYGENSSGKKVIIGHSPTNRQAKGSRLIIDAIKKLSQKHPVELLLIENVPYSKNLEMKAKCDIGVDQIGDLGYGISSLEWLATGVPVATCMAGRMLKETEEHPLTVIDETNIEEKLEELVLNPVKRKEMGLKGRQWLEEYHEPVKSVNLIHEFAGLK